MSKEGRFANFRRDLVGDEASFVVLRSNLVDEGRRFANFRRDLVGDEASFIVLLRNLVDDGRRFANLRRDLIGNGGQRAAGPHNVRLI